MKKYKNLNEQEINSVKKKFGMLTEYSFITNHNDMLLDEDDDELQDGMPAPNQSQGVGVPQPETMNGPEQGVPPTGPDMGTQPESDPAMNTQPAMSDPMVQTPQTPEMPSPEMPAEAPEVEVDVTQLTQDQKQVDDKVTALTDQTAQMMQLLASITDKVEGISTKIENDNESIKQEIASRNPTPKEVLQKRQTLADPFNQTPEDFWKQKEAEGQYELSDGDQEKEYEIKSSDLDDNAMNVYKSFGINDDEVNQSIKGIMGY